MRTFPKYPSTLTPALLTSGISMKKMQKFRFFWTLVYGREMKSFSSIALLSSRDSGKTIGIKKTKAAQEKGRFMDRPPQPSLSRISPPPPPIFSLLFSLSACVVVKQTSAVAQKQLR